MKVKLHKPGRKLWLVSMVVFLIGLVAFFVAIPLLSAIAFYLVSLAAALLLLGTWIF